MIRRVTRRSKEILLFTGPRLLSMSAAFPDDWGWPEPRSFHSKGQLLKSFHLDELFTDEDEDQFSSSESSRSWNNKARYYFMKNPSRLYILLDK